MVLSKDRPDELVAALRNDNMFWRMTAQRLLMERNNKDVVPQLIALVNDKSVDELGINPAAVHALWTLKGLGVVDGSNPAVTTATEQALKHPDSGVRKTAVQVMPAMAQTATVLLGADMLNDKEPLVVLNSVLKLSETPQTPAVQQAILTRLDKTAGDEASDRWLPEAFAVALNSNGGQLMKRYLKQVAMNSPARTPAMPAHDQAAVSQSPAPVLTASASAKPYTAGNLPDLVVATIRTTPESPAVREGARIFVDVTNAGSVAIPDGTPIPLSLQIEGPTGVADQAKINYVSVAHKTGIKPGETVTISNGNNGPWNADFGVNFERAGNYTITAMLDRDNKIAEGNEQNNNATHTLVYRAPQNMSAYVLERATRSYASTAPVDSVVALLRQTQKMNPDESAAIVKGVSEGWNPKQKADIREGDKSFLASLGNTVSADNRDRLNRLYEVWGLTKEAPVESERADYSHEDGARRDALRQERVYRYGGQTGRNCAGKPRCHAA